jgi:acyl-CoA dehydrogenase family member 9
MPLTASQFEQQKRQAEELLFSGPQTLGFAKGLFFGHFNGRLLFPYPQFRPEQQAEADQAVAEVRRFMEEEVDSATIDRDADIPRPVIDGLAGLGVLGMTAPPQYGGRGFSQMAYCKIMEVVGGQDSSIAVFVNAHHSIGIRALLLFGTEEQRQRWLPDLVSGKKLAAFALTEPEAGSDAANVQTMAEPTPDDKGYILNGEKRYITNGGIAQVLTVMARTPVPGSDETKVTAFLVTPDMPGFEVVEASMPKCGIRGTATARLAFRDMFVPKENVLGALGKGLRVALTVLDFGRTTFGASCTGAARHCLRAAVAHARRRRQFKQTLGEFELVKKKIAYMAACAFAMEATTTQCASFIDRGFEDYMLETAMLKVWSTDALWQIVNDTLQIYGGQGYFSHEPYERMMRDARINLIGEGANDVLRVFIAAVGIRPVGESLKGVLEASRSPLSNLSTLWQFGRSQISARLSTPDIPVRGQRLHDETRTLARDVRDFGLTIQTTLGRVRKDALRNHAGPVTNEELVIFQEFYKRQFIQERLADAACELYAASCTLSRLDHLLTVGNGDPDEVRREVQAGRYSMRLSHRRFRDCLSALRDNEDAMTTTTADVILGKE